jgi:crotonobetainyl-CoA:carnitine CoA-transferase CaiB-like acyl-CoA transferase
MTAALATEATGPLKGVRIIDHTSVVFGPYATQILGDLGADVIKIEPLGEANRPGGDAMRANGPRSPHSNDFGPLFISINRNKRSLALDLRTAKDLKIMEDVLREADVFVSNVRAPSLERLGLGYEQVRALKPDIIYAHASGYGAEGRYAERPAYDDVLQAATGISQLFSFGREDGLPRYMPSLVVDKVSGLFLAQAITAALYHRATQHQGQFIEVPMFECLAGFNMIEHLYGHVYDPPIGSIGYARALNLSRRPLKTADIYIAVLLYNLDQWRRFFTVIGFDPALADDPRYFVDGFPQLDLLSPMIEGVLQAAPASEWIEKIAAADLAVSDVKDFGNILSDPHLADVGMFNIYHHPSAGDVRMIRHPVRYSETPANIHRHAPGLGEHSQEILAELAERLAASNSA